SGTFTCTVEAGISTGRGSGCRAVAVNIKKVNNRKETSHIAVMSIDVLVLLTLILAIELMIVINCIYRNPLTPSVFHCGSTGNHRLFSMCCCVGLDNREARFVIGIGQFVDFGSEDVIH